MYSHDEDFEQLRTRLREWAGRIQPDDPDRSEFERDFKTLVELLMFSLIREKDNFFANLLMQFNRKLDFTIPWPAGVCFRRTYFDLLINPLIFLDFTLNEMKAVLIHESYHVLNQHIKRTKDLFGNYSQLLINIACDVSINQYINDLPDGSMTIPNFRDFIERSGGSIFMIEGERELEYYFKLLRTELVDKQEKNIAESTGGDDFERDMSIDNAHNMWDSSDQDDSYENMEDVVRSISNTALQRCRGSVPEEIELIINKLNEKPILSWQEILSRYIGRIPVPYKRTITRKDRRQPDRLDLRGRLPKRYVDVVCAIDTSGSMSDWDIQYCLNEIFHVMKNIKSTLTIIECDSAIRRVYEIKKPEEIQLNVRGRGLTCFSPVFEYMRDNKLKRSILIYFTDGFGESELSITPYHFETLWILTGERAHLSLDEYYGAVRQLQLDKKYLEEINKKPV